MNFVIKRLLFSRVSEFVPSHTSNSSGNHCLSLSDQAMILAASLQLTISYLSPTEFQLLVPGLFLDSPQCHAGRV